MRTNSKRSILIVDDHPLVGLALSELIENLGCEPIGPVAYGDQAVFAAGEHRPDLVLIDVQLKGNVTGSEAAAEIRARFGIPSVFLSGFDDPETRKRADEAEPLAFLPKSTPMSQVADVLLEKLDALAVRA